MSETITADICVIGAGSGGLSVAAGASQMGARTVLVERAKMGGDCLNFGCVPSKALLAAGHAAHHHRDSARFGVAANEPEIDYAAVRDHVADVIAGIAPHDSVERFEGLGVRVVQDHGRFTGDRELVAGGVRVRARRFVVATGSSPLVPPIPGLDATPYFTNETLFANGARMPHLVIIGGGPIGLEMAQAHRRLGSAVTVIEMARALAKDDPEIAAVALARLRAEGIVIEEGAAVERVEGGGGGESITVHARRGDDALKVSGTHLLVAVGRQANVADLGLDAAGVEHSPRGITVDAGLRTSNRRIFAIGDVAGPYQFTHVAGYQAGVILRRALFRLPSRVRYHAVPWVTFTDPEVAHVGLTEAQAEKTLGACRVLRGSFDKNDRARTEGRQEGMIKVVLGRKGRVVGASMVGAHAGELILPWVMMVSGRMKIGVMAGLIAPYPTLSEISKHVAGSYFTDWLFGPRTRRIVRCLARFG